MHTPSSAGVGGVESAPGSKDWGVGAKDLATPFLVSDILEDPCSRYFNFNNDRFLFTNYSFYRKILHFMIIFPCLKTYTLFFPF